MAQLPSLEYEYTDREVTDCFSGYNHRLRIADGELYDSENLTAAHYPLLAARAKRAHAATLTAPGGLLARDTLAYVDDGTLYVNFAPTALTGLSAGKKRLVSMGAYICVFPDKKYYNTADSTDFGSMEAYYSSAGAVSYTLCQSDGTDYSAPTVSPDAPESPANAALWIDTSGETHTLRQWSAAAGEWVTVPTVYTKISFTSYGELPTLFRQYDGVTVSGAQVGDMNGTKLLCAVGGDTDTPDYIVVTGLLEQAVTQSEGTVRIARTVPDMDFVIECRNRLWGCRSGSADGKTVNELYCCALGDFRNWNQFMGVSTDSWTASVGSEGAWTGAVSYLGYPTFFKENRIHRVTVSALGAHQITETVCRGVQRGSENSLAVVNETLFYKSRGDVCAYQGGFPTSVSAALGDMSYSEASAGAAGDRYYISMKDAAGQWQLFTYDIRRGLWMREDGLHAEEFAAVGDELFALSGHELYALLGTVGTREPFVRWRAESGILGYELPDRKYVSRYDLRLQLEQGAELAVYVEYDSSGVWERMGLIRFRGTNTATVPVRPRRCDHLRIRLTGKGDFRLFSVARILTVGSDIG